MKNDEADYSLVVIVPDVGLLLVLLALGLAVGAVPVDQHHQRQHEHHVRNQDSVRYRGQGLRPDKGSIQVQMSNFEINKII